MGKSGSKTIFLAFILIAILTACGKNSTEPGESPILGNWNLTTMKVSGADVNPDDYTKVPVKLLFSFTETGTAWYESNGKPSGSESFGWSTNGGNLNLQFPGETQKSVSYSLNGNQLIITDSSNYQYTYSKQP